MIPIHERSVLVGDVIVVNGYRVNRTSLKARFAEGGYQLHETKHFWLFTRPEEPKTILVHWFAPEEMTTNIPGYLAEELKAFGLVNNSHQLGEVFAGIVGGALFPSDVQRAWNYFGANTLQRLLAFVGSSTTLGVSEYGIFAASAVLYQRVLELCVGERFLDAACNGGFLSLLLAERVPFAREAVGKHPSQLFSIKRGNALPVELSKLADQRSDSQFQELRREKSGIRGLPSYSASKKASASTHRRDCSASLRIALWLRCSRSSSPRTVCRTLRSTLLAERRDSRALSSSVSGQSMPASWLLDACRPGAHSNSLNNVRADVRLFHMSSVVKGGTCQSR